MIAIGDRLVAEPIQALDEPGRHRRQMKIVRLGPDEVFHRFLTPKWAFVPPERGRRRDRRRSVQPAGRRGALPLANVADRPRGVPPRRLDYTAGDARPLQGRRVRPDSAAGSEAPSLVRMRATYFSRIAIISATANHGKTRKSAYRARQVSSRRAGL
jgi:hypothetical protein